MIVWLVGNLKTLVKFIVNDNHSIIIDVLDQNSPST